MKKTWTVSTSKKAKRRGEAFLQRNGRFAMKVYRDAPVGEVVAFAERLAELLNEQDARVMGGRLVDMLDWAVRCSFEIKDPRRCGACGWKLPDHIEGYVGGCPVCMLRSCGQEDTVIDETVIKRFCEKYDLKVVPK